MKLRTEKILRRNDGSRVKIVVDLFSISRGKVDYRFYVQVCGKGKRTWRDAVNVDSYLYRTLSMEDRRALNISESMKIISDAELLDAKMELWESFKPTL